MARIIRSMHGRTVPLALLFGMALFLIVTGVLFSSKDRVADQANAQKSATTWVQVLNTPPKWPNNADDAHEEPASSTSMPTFANGASSTRWVTTATDDSGDRYYMLICKIAGTPTPVNSNPPRCPGDGVGSTNYRWAISAYTDSGTQAVATRLALTTDQEVTSWYAFICDANVSGAACAPTAKQGNGDFDASSPFYVDKRPTFTAYADDSPTAPMGRVTWTSTAGDTDTVVTNDQVTLYVCKTNSFNPQPAGGGGCATGQEYCHSTAGSDPTCYYDLPNTQRHDGNYTAYGFVEDEHGLVATGGMQGTDSVLNIMNVAPNITTSTISFTNYDGDTTYLSLNTPAGYTSGFKLTYTITDENGCQSTTGAREIVTSTINVYHRDTKTKATCQVGGDYDPNNCYVGALSGNPAANWRVQTAQDTGTCTDDTDTDVTWTSTFTMQYVSDPTDGAAAVPPVYASDIWTASVQALDNNGAQSYLTQMQASHELDLREFLSLELGDPNIQYGGLNPGDYTDLGNTVTTVAQGNTGLDVNLNGYDMCTNFAALFRVGSTCPVNPASTIPAAQQKYSEAAGHLYTDVGLATLVNPPGVANLGLHTPKSTVVASPSTKPIYWGIQVPGAITLSGQYTGLNVIEGTVSNSAFW